MSTKLIDYCARSDLEGVKRELRKKNIDVNKGDAWGTVIIFIIFTSKTALHYACDEKEKIEIVKELLKDKKIDINKTPLYWALCDNDMFNIVKLLMKRKDLDVNKGKLPICRACYYGNKKAVILLLLHPDINVNKTDDVGEKASDYAKGDVAKLLNEYEKDKDDFVKKYAQEVIKSKHYYWYIDNYYTFEKRREAYHNEILEHELFKYEGKWNDNDKFEGIGLLSIRSKDKSSYIPQYFGEYEDGQKEGGGKEYSSERKSIIYFGYFKNDKRDGIGIEFDDDENEVRRGVWKEGSFTTNKDNIQPSYYISRLIELSKRIEKDSDNRIFSLLQKARMNDRKKALHNGTYKYEGRWNEHDQFDGIGELSIRSKGLIKRYILHYFGEFNDGKKEGNGKEFSSNGKCIIYYGKFKNNKRHGNGIEYDNNGNEIRRGEWKDGKFIKEEEKNNNVPEYDVTHFKKFIWNPNLPRIFLQRSLLGKGSFCSVYIIDNQYAFKIFPQINEQTSPERFKGMKKLFEAELQNLSNIRHPNICNFIGVSWKPPVGIVMELCKQAISDLLSTVMFNKNGSVLLPLKEKLRIIYYLCVGMEYLHLNHITHRDLKWENVFLTHTNLVKIGDFGLSKYIESFRMSVNHTMVGTPGYIAPEISDVDSCNYSSAVDVFSFGVMVYELMFEKRIIETMRKLLQKGTKEVIMAHRISAEMRKGKRPVIPELKDELEGHEWIVQLIKQCWSGDPKKRPKFTNIIKIIIDNIKDREYEDYIINDMAGLVNDSICRVNLNVDEETPQAKKIRELTVENTRLKKRIGEYVSEISKLKKSNDEKDSEIARLKRSNDK